MNKKEPIKQSLLKLLEKIKQLVIAQRATLQVNICSTAELDCNNPIHSKIVNALIDLNNGKPVWQCFAKRREKGVRVFERGVEGNLLCKGSQKNEDLQKFVDYEFNESPGTLNKRKAIIFNARIRCLAEFLKEHHYEHEDSKCIQDIQLDLIQGQSEDLSKFLDGGEGETQRSILMVEIYSRLETAYGRTICIDNDSRALKDGIDEDSDSDDPFGGSLLPEAEAEAEAIESVLFGVIFSSLVIAGEDGGGESISYSKAELKQWVEEGKDVISFFKENGINIGRKDMAACQFYYPKKGNSRLYLDPEKILIELCLLRSEKKK